MRGITDETSILRKDSYEAADRKFPYNSELFRVTVLQVIGASDVGCTAATLHNLTCSADFMLSYECLVHTVKSRDYIGAVIVKDGAMEKVKGKLGRASFSTSHP